MERERKTGLMERAALRMDLPAEILAGIPKVEITGRSRVKVENHKGILEYTAQCIEISSGRGKICIKGDLLSIRSMNADYLLVEGTVVSVELD